MLIWILIQIQTYLYRKHILTLNLLVLAIVFLHRVCHLCLL
nr:MAG TPA: hypothetical protein [Caudoviricetes sp.]